MHQTSARSILLDPYTTNTHSARMAIWAFDILKYPHPKLLLKIVNQPDWEIVHRLAVSLGRDDDRIYFITDTQAIDPIVTWRVSQPEQRSSQQHRVMIAQPTALLLAQETHRWLVNQYKREDDSP